MSSIDQTGRIVGGVFGGVIGVMLIVTVIIISVKSKKVSSLDRVEDQRQILMASKHIMYIETKTKVISLVRHAIIKLCTNFMHSILSKKVLNQCTCIEEMIIAQLNNLWTGVSSKFIAKAAARKCRCCIIMGHARLSKQCAFEEV